MKMTRAATSAQKTNASTAQMRIFNVFGLFCVTGRANSYSKMARLAPVAFIVCVNLKYRVGQLYKLDAFSGFVELVERGKALRLCNF